MFYRGYYIDGVVFHTKQEIDERIKADNIRALQRCIRCMFEDKPENMMAWNNKATDYEIFLVEQCGMTWEEIEAIEIAASGRCA